MDRAKYKALMDSLTQEERDLLEAPGALRSLLFSVVIRRHNGRPDPFGPSAVNSALDILVQNITKYVNHNSKEEVPHGAGQPE